MRSLLFTATLAVLVLGTMRSTADAQYGPGDGIVYSAPSFSVSTPRVSFYFQPGGTPYYSPSDYYAPSYFAPSYSGYYGPNYSGYRTNGYSNYYAPTYSRYYTPGYSGYSGYSGYYNSGYRSGGGWRR